MKTALDNSFDAPAPVADSKPTREDILGALRWSQPREVATKLGPRLVSSADANDLVFTLWRDEQVTLKSAGYSLGEFRGKWQLSKWEKLPEKVVASRESAKALSRATDADINVPVPDGLALLGYQKAGVKFSLEVFLQNLGVLLSDEQGLGKTVQALVLLNCVPEIRRVLIVTPSSLKLNWRNEARRWLIRKRPILIADSKVFTPLADGIVIINYDVLHTHIEAIREVDWDILICDEAHYLKSGSKSRRGRMVFGVKASAKEKKNGAADIPGITAKRRVLMTGTPIQNRPKEIYPLISYLDPVRWNNDFKFKMRYCGATNNGFGWDFDGASNLEELQSILRSSIMCRRMKADVLKELPPKRRQIIEFPAVGEAAAAVREENEAYEEVYDMEARAELAAASDNPDDFKAAIGGLHKAQAAAFQGMSHLRLITGESKIPMALEHLEEALEDGRKIVVFAHHKSVVAAVAQKFGNIAVMLVGDTKMEDRQAAVERFQKDPSCRLFIGSLLAAGVGITLTASAHVVFIESDWVPGNNWQAEDRTHRIGQRESVLVQYLVLEGSLDATMLRTNIAKQEIIDKALDVEAPKKDEVGAPATPKASTSARDLLAAEAERMTPDQRDAATEAIRYLAGRCNGARDWDGAGFSKLDSTIGRELASKPFLTPKQCALAAKICRKYAKTQLPEALAERLKA